MRRAPLIALLVTGAALVVAYVYSYIIGHSALGWVRAGGELSGAQQAAIVVAHVCNRIGPLLMAALVLEAAWAFLSRRPRDVAAA